MTPLYTFNDIPPLFVSLFYQKSIVTFFLLTHILPLSTTYICVEKRCLTDPWMSHSLLSNWRQYSLQYSIVSRYFFPYDQILCSWKEGGGGKEERRGRRGERGRRRRSKGKSKEKEEEELMVGVVSLLEAGTLIPAWANFYLRQVLGR